MRKIAEGEDYPLPATIDDPSVLGEINRALAAAGYARR
jgi:propionyl-CoA synthetase